MADELKKVHGAKDAETAVTSLKSASNALAALANATENKEVLLEIREKLTPEQRKVFDTLHVAGEDVEKIARREVYTAFKRVRGAILNNIPDLEAEQVSKMGLSELRSQLAIATEMYTKNPRAFPSKVVSN